MFITLNVYSVNAMPINDAPIEEQQCILEALTPLPAQHPRDKQWYLQLTIYSL